eukprot:1794670-Pyramimonas_sp.AAC.1
MKSDLKSEATKNGLKVHLGKVKLFTDSSRQLPGHVLAAGADVETAPVEGAERCLGRQLRMGSFHGTELSSRLNAVWRCVLESKDMLQS